MKVALEAGEVLDVALLEGDRVIGTLSLQIKGVAKTSKVGRPAGVSSSASSSDDGADAPVKKRKARKPLSPEVRARMAAAQKARWEQRRAGNK